MSADIFAGQPADADLLAEIYDLEHDLVVEDLDFYRQLASRNGTSPVLDLGCGSGRLFGSLLAGGTRRLTGVDGSPALLRRARVRIAADEALSRAKAVGQLSLVQGDVRHLGSLGLRPPHDTSGYGLAVAAGVLPHLDGPEEAMELLTGVRALLAPGGLLVLDDLGPAQLPERDLPLSIDWRRKLEHMSVVRRSQLQRREDPGGLTVLFSTMVDVGRPDGTIARLPASHRLWYPFPDALTALVREAGLTVELGYGSHDLDPLEATSERRIFMIRRPWAMEGEGRRSQGRRQASRIGRGS